MARSSAVQVEILKLLSREHFLTAPQILDKLKKHRPELHKTSVYRAIDSLSLEGKLCKQIFEGNTVVYELQGDHHDHAVCEDCGKIEAIDCVSTSEVTVPGFTPSHHHVVLFGVCQDCNKIETA